MEHLVVDGMNVIGSRPTGWWRDRDGAVRTLVQRLRRLHAATGQAITVVLDGRPLPDLPEATRHGVAVAYARRAGADAADERIVEIVAGDARPTRLCVATADRRLRDAVTQLGAGVVGPGWLLSRLDALDQREDPQPA